jgi:hypothetical protein
MHTTIDVYVYVFSVNIYVQKGKTIMIDGHWTLDTVTLIPLGTTIVPARDPKQFCREHEVEILRYQNGFCKLPLGRFP